MGAGADERTQGLTAGSGRACEGPRNGVAMSGYRSATVARGVVFVQGPSVNWIILDGAAGPVLIDTGYPGDEAAVRASLRDAGHAVRELAAILITHGHGDHMGNAAAFAAEASCPVFTSAEEIPNVRREICEQVEIRDVLPHAFRPGVFRWALHALRAGGKKAAPVLDARPLPDDLADAVGVDIQPVPLPGHTRGHTGFLLPHAGVLITGDALVSGHPTSPLAGPQLLARMFHAIPEDAIDALSTVEALDARVTLPGHGPALSERPALLADQARATSLPF